MMAYAAQEYIVTPETTYILLGGNDHYRRIFTDGREWPANVEPTYQGYSIGRWSTRTATGATTPSRSTPAAPSRVRAPMTGPGCRCISTISRSSRSGSSDKADPNILHDEITVSIMP